MNNNTEFIEDGYLFCQGENHVIEAEKKLEECKEQATEISNNLANLSDLSCADFVNFINNCNLENLIEVISNSKDSAIENNPEFIKGYQEASDELTKEIGEIDITDEDYSTAIENIEQVLTILNELDLSNMTEEGFNDIIKIFEESNNDNNPINDMMEEYFKFTHKILFDENSKLTDEEKKKNIKDIKERFILLETVANELVTGENSDKTFEILNSIILENKSLTFGERKLLLDYKNGNSSKEELFDNFKSSTYKYINGEITGNIESDTLSEKALYNNLENDKEYARIVGLLTKIDLLSDSNLSEIEIAEKTKELSEEIKTILEQKDFMGFNADTIYYMNKFNDGEININELESGIKEVTYRKLNQDKNSAQKYGYYENKEQLFEILENDNEYKTRVEIINEAKKYKVLSKESSSIFKEKLLELSKNPDSNLTSDDLMYINKYISGTITKDELIDGMTVRLYQSASNDSNVRFNYDAINNQDDLIKSMYEMPDLKNRASLMDNLENKYEVLKNIPVDAQHPYKNDLKKLLEEETSGLTENDKNYIYKYLHGEINYDELKNELITETLVLAKHDENIINNYNAYVNRPSWYATLNNANLNNAQNYMNNPNFNDVKALVNNPRKLKFANETYNILRGYGFNHVTTCAMMGNIMQESKFDIAVEGKGSYGVFQLAGDRRTGYNDYVTAHPGIDDFTLQLMYFNEIDLQGQEEFFHKNSGMSIEDFTNLTDVETAAKVFSDSFERPDYASANVPARQEFARFFYNEFQ